MEPNDLPIVVLPLELSDDSAANLIAFLHSLIEGLQRHYAAGASAPRASALHAIPAAASFGSRLGRRPAVLTTHLRNPIVRRSTIIRTSQPNWRGIQQPLTLRAGISEIASQQGRELLFNRFNFG